MAWLHKYYVYYSEKGNLRNYFICISYDFNVDYVFFYAIVHAIVILTIL